MTAEASPASSSLLAIYVAKRSDLVRFFTTRTASAAEAEDIVQEIYLKLARVEPETVGNPTAYIYRLGTNVMLDRARSRRRATARDGEYLNTSTTTITGIEPEAETPSPEAVMEGRQKLASLLRAVRELPAQCQRVFVMHKLQDKSYGEIAAELGISKSAVEKHMMTALKRLGDHRP